MSGSHTSMDGAPFCGYENTNDDSRKFPGLDTLDDWID